MRLPPEMKSQILTLDGSEVRTVAGYVVYTPARDAADLDDLDAVEVANRLAQGWAADGPALYPIGQDAALCSAALAECANLEALVNTLRQRVSAQLRQARKLKILDENNAWAESHGTRYPVAQGPMTRERHGVIRVCSGRSRWASLPGAFAHAGRAIAAVDGRNADEGCRQTLGRRCSRFCAGGHT